MKHNLSKGISAFLKYPYITLDRNLYIAVVQDEGAVPNSLIDNPDYTLEFVWVTEGLYTLTSNADFNPIYLINANTLIPTGDATIAPTDMVVMSTHYFFRRINYLANNKLI